MGLWRSCYYNAVANAVAKVNNPLLTIRHEQNSNRPRRLTTPLHLAVKARSMSTQNVFEIDPDICHPMSDESVSAIGNSAEQPC
ncbi:hypothetical protein OY671_011408, partial [Metschnikowia pulcherrima]